MISLSDRTSGGGIADAQRPPDTSLLAEITADLGAGHDVEALLRRFLLPIVTLAGAQAGAVRVFCDETRRLRLVGHLGLAPEVVQAEALVDRHCGVCGVATHGQQLAWSEAAGDCKLHGVRASGAAGGGCAHVLAVPLAHRGRLLGVYNLFFETAVRSDDGVQTVLRAVGDLLGLALDHLRLEREHLRATVLAERQLMAAEVHDSVAQTLTFVKMRLPLLQQAIEGDERARALKYVADVRGAVTQAHASLREILTHYRAPVDPKGLLHALADCARQFPARTGVALAYANRAGALELSTEQEAQAFHVVQEALANVAQHAHARHAWLSVDARDGLVEIVVEDDGTGPRAADDATAAGPTHHGLMIMGERARRLGGQLEIGRRAGGGTRVRLAFPRAGADARTTA
ncbi:histidine kinase [Calidifontimicrobium sp. SYSU G02091]|uniref:GAF domain-containing sensor histidine kinase n=1 Tax=Calidifontimicrobium sp. SYSU G02091 TaxID=2926421 RepID=UPI001F535D90|nr:ATP-binding protein [Calidifontimicrobium sp. SYSU G02091]MCI1193049.1 histidine kinase [Calidifontimicrobium sp. SYSU G02091]